MKVLEMPEIPKLMLDELEEKFRDAQPYVQINFPQDLSKEFVECFKEYTLANTPIKKIGVGWINARKKIEGTNNYFHWHTEEVHNFPLNSMYILWVCGERGKGGEFKCVLEDGDIGVVPFEPPKCALIGTSTPHYIESYFGDKHRVSININVEV